MHAFSNNSTLFHDDNDRKQRQNDRKTATII